MPLKSFQNFKYILKYNNSQVKIMTIIDLI